MSDGREAGLVLDGGWRMEGWWWEDGTEVLRQRLWRQLGDGGVGRRR